MGFKATTSDGYRYVPRGSAAPLMRWAVEASREDQAAREPRTYDEAAPVAGWHPDAIWGTRSSMSADGVVGTGRWIARRTRRGHGLARLAVVVVLGALGLALLALVVG